MEITNTLENPKYQYESYDNFQPGAETKRFIKNNRILTTGYYLTAINVGATSAFSGLYNLLFVENYISEPIKGIYGEKLPYYMWSPLDITGSIFNYTCLFFYQSFAVIIYGLIIAGLDLFCYDVIRHTTAHVINLKGALKTLRERALAKASKNNIIANERDLVDPPELEKYMMYELVKCIDHSQALLRFVFGTKGQPSQLGSKRI